MIVDLFPIRTSSSRFDKCPRVRVDTLFYLVKYLPTWMPGAGFKRNALSVRKDVEKMLGMPFDMVKNNMVRGSMCIFLSSARF
jgi:hypothetical protein